MKYRNISVLIFLTLFLFKVFIISAQEQDTRGVYFAKKQYDGDSIPVYSDSKAKLPVPILEDNPEWVDMYWECWELAFQHFKKPPEDSPFVSNIMDEAFNPNIFQWDMIFMVMFARYGNHVFPAVNSLDNFYCNQHSTGYICREIAEKDGSDFVYLGREHTINPPLFGWAEIESFKNTGDLSRLEMVLPVLEKYAEWLEQEGDLVSANDQDSWDKHGRRAANSEHDLYWNTTFGSGMDNTPRYGNGWVDMSSQMIIQYKNLALISRELGMEDKENIFMQAANSIGERINSYCWNDEDGLYYDVDSLGEQVKFKTAACFWPLLAGIASENQCTRLIENLKNSITFWRKSVFPSLAADEEDFNPMGGYWLGGVWAPTNYMIIKGLEKYGYEEFARQVSLNFIDAIYRVYLCTGTFWENYMPDYYAPGQRSKPDFVGWTGVGPIALLIENVLGFRINARENTLTWHLNRTDKHGIKNLRIGDNIVTALCNARTDANEKAKLSVSVSKELQLKIFYNGMIKEYKLSAGQHNLFLE